MRYLNEFINETYPGAKKSPVDMVKMMATPEIKPDATLAGKLKFFSKSIGLTLNKRLNLNFDANITNIYIYFQKASAIMNVNSGAAAKCGKDSSSDSKKDGRNRNIYK